MRDLRRAVRSLLRTPAATAAALIALALGIGANTAIFSVTSGLLLRDLPVREPDRVMAVWEENRSEGFETSPVGAPTFQAWRRSPSFEGLAALTIGWANVTGPGEPELIRAARVTPGFFTVAGANLAFGRDLRPADARPGVRTAVISHRLWRERFGEDRRRLAEGIGLDGERYAVVGVAPPRFSVLGDWDVWTPLRPSPFFRSPGERLLRVIGRLKPGIAPGAAERSLEAIQRGLGKRYPGQLDGWGVRLVPLRIDGLLEIRRALLLLTVAVGCVLLIACADIAGLLLARALSRERELAVRAALGGGRARLVRELVAESGVLFLAGGGLGVLLAVWGTPALVAAAPTGLPDPAGIGVDGRVLLFGLALSLGTGVLFGLIPALAVTGGRLGESLKDAGRRIGGRPGGRLVRDLLVAGQVALTVILTIAAGLVIRSFDHLRAVDPGFRSQGIFSVQLMLPAAGFSRHEERDSFFEKILARVRGVPGVKKAALVDFRPLDPETWQLLFATEEDPEPAPGEMPYALSRRVSPGYFDLLEIPLVRGRTFRQADGQGAEPVVVVSEGLAAGLWPGQNPIGRKILFGNPEEAWRTVVGVVRDTRQGGLAAASPYEVYWPLLQGSSRWAILLVRVEGPPPAVLARVGRAVRKVDPGLPVGLARSVEALIARDLAPDRFKSLLLALLTAVALLLAAVGIYGVAGASVARRTHEIAVRVAVGARPWDILRLVVLRGMAPVLAGLAVGLAVAWPLGRLLADQLHGVRSGDGLTFTLATAVILLVGLAACYFPAVRATQVDPVAAWRAEG
ncbi:MAG: ABC transporter permease [Thermoanaerobaculia bacterium]